MAAGMLCGLTFSEQRKSVEALLFSQGHTKVRHNGQWGQIRPDISK